MLIKKENYYSDEEILDSLLEKAFCEGYEYAQREFNSKEMKALRAKYNIKEGKKAMIKALFSKDKDAITAVMSSLNSPISLLEHEPTEAGKKFADIYQRPSDMDSSVIKEILKARKDAIKAVGSNEAHRLYRSMNDAVFKGIGRRTQYPLSDRIHDNNRKIQN